MYWRQAVERIVELLRGEPAVEGAFLGGSLASKNWDKLSDIDIAIVTVDDPEELDQVYAMRCQIASTVGRPVHSLERQWGHCRMIALLFGRSQYPPLGLEIDIFFSQLSHISELMPGATFSMVFDRNGRLAPQLGKLNQIKLRSEIKQELEQQMAAFPFDANHAAKALLRGDFFHLQFVLERMRSAIYSAAASRYENLITGSKRASRYLAAPEREIIGKSCQDPTEESIRQLVELYLALLSETQHHFGLERQVGHLSRVLSQVAWPVKAPETSP